MKKVTIVRLLIAALLIASVAGGAWWWRLRDQETATDHLILYGNTDIRQANLAFNGNEHIARMLVEEGDKVKRGQLLATLDTERLEHAVAQAEAQVAAQQQVLARLEAGTRIEEINQARAEVDVAVAQANDAQRSLRRVQDLAAKKLASQQQLDDARSTSDTTAARLKSAQAALALALAGPRKEDIAAARATLKAFEAQLALARQELADASLYAPADGVIRDRILEPGDFATPQSPVYTLALIEPVWVRAYLAEPDLGKVRLGMRAWVSTDSYPGKRYEGWVGYISPTAEFTPKAVETQDVRTNLVYQVRVYACNPQDELRLGMPATVTVPLDQRPAARQTAGAGHCEDR